VIVVHAEFVLSSFYFLNFCSGFRFLILFCFQPIHASKRIKPSPSTSSSHATPAGTIALHSIPKRAKTLPTSSSKSQEKIGSNYSKRTSGPRSSKRSLPPVVFSSSSSDGSSMEDEKKAKVGSRSSGDAQEMFAGASWLSGDAAPSSRAFAAASGDSAAVADGAVASDDGGDQAAAICSDDDTSGDGDIILDGGLRVRLPQTMLCTFTPCLICSRFHVHCGAHSSPSNARGCGGCGVCTAEATAEFWRMRWVWGRL
jgi:hypothetical protein